VPSEPIDVPGLIALRGILRTIASDHLERTEPSFVEAVRKVSPTTLEVALANSQGSLKSGLPRVYHEVFQRIADILISVELATRAVSYMEAEDPSVGDLRDPLRWFVYHSDTSALWCHAVVDKSQALMKVLQRRLIRTWWADTFQEFEARLIQHLASLEEISGTIRHPLAHGRPREGYDSQEGRWEAAAVLGDESLDETTREEALKWTPLDWTEGMLSWPHTLINSVDGIFQELADVLLELRPYCHPGHIRPTRE